MIVSGCLFIINLQTDALRQKEIMHQGPLAFLEQEDGLVWGVRFTEPGSFLTAWLHSLLCPLAEHFHAVARMAHRQPLSVRGGELTCQCSVPIIHRLEGGKKNILLLFTRQMAQGKTRGFNKALGRWVCCILWHIFSESSAAEQCRSSCCASHGPFPCASPICCQFFATEPCID